MTDVDPALVARLDQCIAHTDELVPTYISALADAIAMHGRETGISLFICWLRDTHTPDAAVILAAGAITRLIESR
ncbi:hypothetical protein GCM10023321_63900 [Pseudonocardia eucalypti]|uniref:ANTAR domain-containing protein n=1 Tax=Pseudonocardia eucalypti TaxID=648755 RepID=A0ABP9QXJ4_9PSEU|nr:hypothetical protein [Pseudonocardia eucalypti]